MGREWSAVESTQRNENDDDDNILGMPSESCKPLVMSCVLVLERRFFSYISFHVRFAKALALITLGAAVY